MPPVGFEPTISAGERPHCHVLSGRGLCVGSLVDWLLVGRLIGWLVGRLIGWLIGCLVVGLLVDLVN